MGEKPKKLIISVAIIVLSVSLFSFRHTPIPLLDTQTDQYFEEVSKKSVSAYAVTRGVNAVVSIIKESELYISPGGMGVSIAAGQVLDPLDDMTERLSDILVLSIVSIGIQKIAFEVGQMVSFTAISLILPLLLIPLWWPGNILARAGIVLTRLVLILFVLRFFLPGSMLINNYFYAEFMEDNIGAQKDKLRIITEGSSGVSKFDTLDYKDGIIDTINNSLTTMSIKIDRMKDLYKRIRNNLGSIISSLLDLTILYATIFVVQIILIPLLVLWLTIKFINMLFHKPVDYASIMREGVERPQLIQSE